MNLLAPWLLSGLAALAVPILVHLIRRRDPQRTPFPSLMFMEGAPHEARGQRSLRDPWLLVLRLLALAAAVLAFAGPVLDSKDDLIAVEQSGDLVVALDRSASMGYGDRWERARQSIEARLDAMPPGTRAALVLFDASAERAIPLDQDTGAFRAALANAQPRTVGTDIRAGVAAAGALLAQSDADRRELVLVSDFQRGAWRADGASLLPPGTQVEVVHVAGDEVVNAAVNDVRLAVAVTDKKSDSAAQPQISEQDRAAASGDRGEPPAASAEARTELQITATVARRGGSAPDWAALVVGGREVERIALNAADDITTVRFEPLPTPRAPVAASVRIEGDEYGTDDIRHVVLAPEPALRVLIIDDSPSSSARAPGGGLYLRSALALAESPPMSVHELAAAALSASDLEGTDAVVVNDARVDGSTHTLLARYVRDGGGLWMIAGGRVGNAWPGGADDYLPGQIGGRVEAPRDEPLKLVDPGGLAASEGLFDGFNLRGASLGSVWRYRRITTGSEDRVLLRYADGGVALVERRTGLGRTVVLTSALDNRWNSIPVAPVFVPFVHRLIAELSGHEAPLRSFSTGSALDVERWLQAQADAGPLRQALSSGARLALRAPGGSRDTLRDGTSVIQLRQPGVYELDRADGTGPELMWAANPPAAESELDPIDPGIVLNALVRMAATQSSLDDQASMSADGDAGLELWRAALALALVLLLAETWLSNRGGGLRSQTVAAQ